MDAILVGYFPKRTALRPPWVHANHVVEIASVSECISAGPEDWINRWQHNVHWLYDSPAQAVALTGDHPEAYDIYAYKLYPLIIEYGRTRPFEIVPTETAALSGDFQLLGYDAVSRSLGTTFECSPLSCNDAAHDFEVNRHCLFESYDAALDGATKFSTGSYEPGPYWIVEVYRYDRKLNYDWRPIEPG